MIFFSLFQHSINLFFDIYFFFEASTIIYGQYPLENLIENTKLLSGVTLEQILSQVIYFFNPINVQINIVAVG